MIATRKLGRIIIDATLFNDFTEHQSNVTKVFNDCFITHAYYDTETCNFVYIVWNCEFRELEKDEPIPDYIVSYETEVKQEIKRIYYTEV